MTPEPETGRRPPLRLRAEQQPPWTVVYVSGELDWESRPRFDRCLSAAARQDVPPRICLDLSGLVFCDSSGIAAMMRAQRDITQRGGQLLLRAPPASIARKVISMGLASSLPVVDDLPG